MYNSYNLEAKEGFLDLFLKYLLNSKNTPSKSTVKNYKADINQFIKWFEEEFKEKFNPKSVTPQILEIYQKSKTNSSKSISNRSLQRHLSSLRKFFSFLKAEGIIETTPFQSSTLKSELSSLSDPWQIKEFKKYLKSSNKSDLTIKNYILDLLQIQKWVEEVTGSKSLEAVNQELTEEYITRLLEKNLSPLSINRKLSSLRSFLNWVNQEELIDNQQKTRLLASSLTSKRTDVVVSDDLRDINLTRNETNRQYSSIPPVRLFQKISKGFSFLFDSVVLEPLTQTFDELDYRLWKLKGKPIFQNQKSKIKDQNYSSKIKSHESTSNIPKGFYAPLAISTANYPLHKKMLHHLHHKRPEWYKRYHSYGFTHYFHLAILVAFMSGVGIYFSNNLNQKDISFSKQDILGTFASSRVLSFSGRLTDKINNPINSSHSVRFSIYDSPTASGSSLFWQEVKNVTPDKDGNFEVILGDTLAGDTPISTSVFSDNPSLWLGITVENEQESMPRSALPTAALASDSKTLNGMPLITDSNSKASNVVLALDSSGNLTIKGNSNHTFQTTNGQFTISGEPLLLTTNIGSSGDVVIAPDGLGRVNIQKPIYNSLFQSVDIQSSLNIVTSSTTSANIALSINQESLGDLISASSGGAVKFRVDNNGGGYFASNLGIGIKNPQTPLDIHSSINGETISLFTKTGTSSGAQAYEVFGDTDTIKRFKVGLNAGAVLPGRIGYDIVDANSNTSLLSILQDGNVGVGVSNPSYQLQLSKDSAAKPTSNTWTVVSDRRLKDNILPFKDGLEILNKINPVSYILNGKANTPKDAKGIGIIAQEVKDFIPYTISTFKAKLNPNDTNETELFSFDSSALTFVLINAVKELENTINQQKLILVSQKVVSPLSEIDQLHTNVISPLTPHSDVIVRLGSSSATQSSKFKIEDSNSTTVASIDNLGNATFSGQLNANSASVSGELFAKDLLASSVQVSQASLASFSAELSYVNSLTTGFTTVTEGLISLGPTSLSDVSISNQLIVGKTIGGLMLSDNTINVFGKDIELQSLRQGGVSIAGGNVYIDLDGNLKTKGNADILGNLNVNGTLSTNIVSPLSSSDFVVKLNDNESKASKSGFIIQNASGSSMLTIDNKGNLYASGAAEFKELLSKAFNIIRSAQADTSLTETLATSSAGTATIVQGEKERTIISPFVTEQSLIYITPTSDTQGVTPYVARQVAEDKANGVKGSFTIQIPQGVYKDISLNWWIVN